MSLAVILLVVLATVSLFLSLVFKGVLQRKNEASKSTSINDFEILVPFRNEASNLVGLVHDLKAESLLDQTWWLDDASVDNGAELLKEHGVQPDRIWSFQKQVGKKMAISEGVKRCVSKHVLTFDADVRLEVGYGEAIRTVELEDLNILPVQMIGKSFWGDFFAWDFAFQWDFGNVIAKLFRPIVCSGANLCFNREVFLELEKLRTDQDIASGDDQFLLAAMRNTNRQISLVRDGELLVYTQAPNSWKECIRQRRRWLSKSKQVGDHLANLLGVAGVLFVLFFYGGILFAAFTYNHFFIVAFGFWVPLHELWMTSNPVLPAWQRYVFGGVQLFYVLSLAIGSMLYRPKWNK